MQGIQHPGTFIRELILKPQNITITKLAKLTGINRSFLNDIVNGESRISIAVAMKLGQYTNTEPKKWLDYQKDYDTKFKINTRKK